jgi:hypothetical protein
MATSRRIVTSISEDEAIDLLKENVKEGDTIWTIVRWYSKSSGMRIIDLIVIKENKPLFIGRQASAALQRKYDEDKEGLVTGGWGMDFAFDLVYRLSEKLFGSGYKLEKRSL